MELTIQQRTDQQNKAMHLWFDLLASTFNEAGLDQRKVLKPSVEIPWTPEAIKEQLWRPVMKTYIEKDSTTELTPTEVTKIYDILNKHLGEKFHVFVEWPHRENYG